MSALLFLFKKNNKKNIEKEKRELNRTKLNEYNNNKIQFHDSEIDISTKKKRTV